jgi:hypothetical protein
MYLDAMHIANLELKCVHHQCKRKSIMANQNSGSTNKPIIVIIRSVGEDIERGGSCGANVDLYGSAEKNVTIEIKDQTAILSATQSDQYGAWKVTLDNLQHGLHVFAAGDAASGTVSDSYEVGYPKPPEPN